MKCAYLIEICEAITEIIKLYNKTFLVKKQYNTKKIILKDHIAAIISQYGMDIFEKEYNLDKESFLDVLAKTRHRIMHIKRKQPKDYYLSGPESVLYSAKFLLLYRVILLSLLDVDYNQYKSNIKKIVEILNNWYGIFNGFNRKLNCITSDREMKQKTSTTR